MDEVIVRVEGRVGRLTLNRPQALNALTLSMCEAMTQALMAWRDDPAIDLVLIDHAGERGFCAGGDIRMLAQSGAQGGTEARAFFLAEYRLNHLLFVYAKPVVAVMDGITMGGGVGLARPARYRIATERTVFAMPETGIGLFPDVGGGWFLSRIPGQVGLWLALSGARLRAADCLLVEAATDYLESAAVEAFKARLIAQPAAIDRLLADMSAEPGPAPLLDRRSEIARLFGQKSVEDIFAALAASDSAWAAEQLQALQTKSPQTLKVAFRLLQSGANFADFAQEMETEYRVAARVVVRHDFLEGVRALIVEKDNAPRWDPPNLEAVTEAMLDEIFAPLPDNETWSPLA